MRKRIKVKEKTHEQIIYISKILGKPIIKFLEELINEIFSDVATFTSLNIEYTHFPMGILYLQFSGRSRIISGSFDVSDKITEKQVQAKILKDFEMAQRKAEESE